ncbi:nitroreductase family deazaflavin-dependent oxidoreductase [Gordonia amarae]|nr:nitroreductase/quinone reductase family protein [Gordonia amarae]MCS3878836.1 deazaflavin-dependent oxidoreductase (nitroreductase family) [Gordonia amarae]QHN17401.1 nitroreductase family deazaflavin-dependent oxidoreductase [Gordonia amarae]QHN21927.1 nitroreductase family deazaflavin-dependent oxidoreductase [Gordonia amarae]QHN30807.1 nitroreductase family deazaflavin-dependent oxidoreductase [Gordonia amarae]QHN39553.1 nitroreductase family deazaflavin-dependent oxidoreductase [Gordoni
MRYPDRAADAGAWLLENSHRALLTLSGGRFPKNLLGMKTVELHTVGRKSGKQYTTLLTTPIHDASRVVLVASKGGSSKDPDWFRNAVATPDITVVVDGEPVPMRARVATDDEHAELWPQAVKVYKSYADYQANTDRKIPILICERR